MITPFAIKRPGTDKRTIKTTTVITLAVRPKYGPDSAHTSGTVEAADRSRKILFLNRLRSAAIAIARIPQKITQGTAYSNTLLQ
jgi:hypothetical protein